MTRYLKAFDSVYKGRNMIESIKRVAAPYKDMTKANFKASGKSVFNQLSVNALTNVASYFDIRGKDFAKLRLINRKMKKAYERHVLSFIHIERL